MLSDELLKILICPITKEPLKIAPNNVIKELNSSLESKIEAAVINESGTYAYPVINGIPAVLTGEAINLRG